MKTFLLALTLGSLATVAAAADSKYYSPEITALHTECAAKYYANEYKDKADYAKEKDAYAKNEYSGAKSECSEQQYAAYLEGVDPARVMAAYPSAAGRPAGYKGDYKADYKADAAKPYKPDGDPDAKYDKAQYDKTEKK
ncbi:MAG TPA: hypothetical protein VGM81_07215 [Burkholderiaceae bacterium]